MRISLEQAIVKNYKGVELLGPIDLELFQGLIGLIGPNGAGKSTMIKLIAQIYSASSGHISFLKNGLPISLFEAKKSIGYVPQEIALYDDLTVRRFLRYIAGLKCVEKVNIDEEIERLSHTFMILPLLDKKIASLSIGQKRKIMIVQAFLSRPMVVLLDEPFVGLDIEERKRVLHYVMTYSKQAIILVASHLLEEMNDEFDRFIILKKQQIIADLYPDVLNGLSDKSRLDKWLEDTYLSLIKR